MTSSLGVDWDRVGTKSWRRCSHTRAALHRWQGHHLQHSLLAGDNPTSQATDLIPRLVQQHRGISALLPRAVCVLQQGSADRLRDRRAMEE